MVHHFGPPPHLLLCGFDEVLERGDLRFEDGDPIRLQLHSQRLLKRSVPLLQALESEIQQGSWIEEATHALAALIKQLDAAAIGASDV